MIRQFTVACALLTICANSAVAQRTLNLEVAPKIIDNTPVLAPEGCRTEDAIAAIRNWFRAVSTGDTTLARSVVAPSFQWVSVNPFKDTHANFAGTDIPSLSRYVSQRAAFHEQFELQEVTLNFWRGRELHMGPLYFLRYADDLGAVPLKGNGKAAWLCGEGLIVLSVAHRVRG